MAYVVTDACIKDFLCAEQCATSAIAPMAGDSAADAVTQVYINPVECIDCGACAGVCTQGAIFAESDLPADKVDFAQKNQAYFQ
ncbi:MAG TPA: ferredoxin family protein [Terracidiphilus sp.]|nr:ferredoxin family protein [Terracidiphilus sp.]